MNFTFDHALQLTKKMHARYGEGFARQWKGFKSSEIAQEFFEELQSMTPDQIARGLRKMKTHEYAPNVSQFSNWCMGDLKSQWLGANEAWNIARGSIDFNGYELTVVWTKECSVAFDAVADMVRLGDKYQIAEAKKVFVERYERLVSEALERGEKPIYNVSYGDDKEQRKTALREAELAGLLPSGESQLLIETTQSPNDARGEAAKFKTIAQEHLAKLKEQLKTVNVKTQEEVSEDVKLFKLPEKLDCWADPFEDAEKYKQTLIKEGKSIPMALRSITDSDSDRTL